MKHLSKGFIDNSLVAVPEILHAEIRAVWQQLQASSDASIKALKEQDFRDFSHVLACSEFVQKQTLLHPQFVLESFTLAEQEKLSLANNFQQKLYLSMQSAKDEAGVLSVLRRARNQQMLLIAWADALGAKVETVIASLSTLADCFIHCCTEWAYQTLCQRFGRPRDEGGVEQKLVVIGMGKLGANELNFSSDIDLIYCYPSSGETDGARGISNEEFFLKMARLLTNLLDKKTVDGFVFRVDTRLRPFGNSGALAPSFAALEVYYQTSAREWERYAMVKARLITGEKADKDYLASMLKSFVYRRYLDYGVFDSIRVMKKQIDEQLRKKDNEDSVKLGPGGIREIEFIGQALQLVRGGRDISLQQRSILPLLGLLAEKGIIEQKSCQELSADYNYLRRLENAIQQIADLQTHAIPKDTLSQTRLVQAMRVTNWASLLQQTQQVMQRVHGYFNELVVASAADELPEKGAFDWLNAQMPELIAYFEGNHFSEAELLAKNVDDFCGSYRVRQAQQKGRHYLNLLLTLLFKRLAHKTEQSRVVSAFLQLLEKIATRTAYLVLLVENERVLQHLLDLTLKSPWVVSQISQTPILLDELIDPRRLYSPPSQAEMVTELNETLAKIAPDDEEQLIDALRIFKQVNVLRVAAADLTGAISLTKVSDKLTAIAEVIINKVLQLSWQTTVVKYGVPAGAKDNVVSGFSIIGFGKLGGFELGFSSDLDLVFLHRDYAEDEMTLGDKAVSLSVFYSRLVRRIISLLTIRTQSGPLYEIDLRLRPNGNSGLLVSSVSAFKRYQIEQAWTWEQQALVRARAINTSHASTAEFSLIREQSLCRVREEVTLKEDITRMRKKMRDNLLSKRNGCFDLKQGQGGIVDIEFIVQFGVLTHAVKSKALIQYTDNIRLLKELASIGFLTAQQSQTLTQAYQHYREASHHSVLAERKAIVDSTLFEQQAAAVSLIWNDIFK